ncbi:transglycosylase SLT domain-containing protein [Psychromonas hadalis]|uniref:transglycosylase SLT domain-containing protein n=1 Tax=Psychromonas hadalis TaxID=211669 RepID=UPI00041253F9|nr:transglycosylase SLT domain-containing protein [Psychromonas hadalis]
MKRYLFIIFSILFASNVFSLSLNQQRAVYSEAQLLQSQNRWNEADVKLASIPVYPLTYFLTYQHLKENFSQQSLTEIDTFIIKNKRYKISDDLQREYLYYLAGKQYWSDFLIFYPQLPRSSRLKCFYFQAKMATGKEKEIWPEVEKFWLSGYSRPNSCDVTFNTYLKNKKISQKLIWQRFELAYNSNQKALMNHLINLMKGGNKLLAKQLATLNHTPKKLAKSKLFQHRDQVSYSFLKPTLKRLAREDIQLGLQVFHFYEQNVPFSFNDEIYLKKYFSSRILIKNEQSLLPWLDETLLFLGDIKLIEQRIRYAIKYNNWVDIARWIDVLPVEEAQKTTWIYWQARVLENKKQFKEADKLYQQIANKRKYYGFLAAQKLGLSYQLNARIVEPKVTSLRYVQAQLEHIEELSFHQYTSLRKREWERLLKGRDSDMQRQLGLYAFDKGWAHLSVVASIRSKSWDALNIRFPEVKPALFLENAKRYQLPRSYIYAITRQESSFDQFANSPVGATGYMQLMPATAKETARKIGLKSYKRKAQLTEGKINVQLGSAYFNSLLKRYGGNRILATAAYNAGPHRVDRWKQNKKGRDNKALSMDSWVETIPYKETRRYVKNVLAYNVIYQHILKKPMEFFNAIELNAHY